MSDREKFERRAREMWREWCNNHFDNAEAFVKILADAIEQAVAEKQIMLGNADAIIGAQVETITEKQAEIDRLKESHAALANRINELLIETDRLKALLRMKEKAFVEELEQCIKDHEPKNQALAQCEARLEEAIKWIKKLRDSAYWRANPNNVYTDTEIFLQKVKPDEPKMD